MPARRARGKLWDDYLELIRQFPLRPIRNHREYDAAAAVIDRLAVRPEGSLTPGERDYFETLTLLIQEYDERHFKLETARMAPLEALKYLMSESGMKPADLGRLLGNRPLASLILNSHRELSKTHIRILAEHFKVDPSLFL
jgi:HTH-type transcriptional regulator/antitoxin HigA